MPTSLLYDGALFPFPSLFIPPYDGDDGDGDDGAHPAKHNDHCYVLHIPLPHSKSGYTHHNTHQTPPLPLFSSGTSEALYPSQP